MIIAMLNGSPKVKESNSQLHLSILEERLKAVHTIKKYRIHKELLSEGQIQEMIESDVLIIAFPLYIDGIPSHLLEQMMILEKAYQAKQHQKTIVYAIANNGFYEGEQNEYAFQMIRHFCVRAGIRWGQGLGIGAGEMVGGLCRGKMPIGKGPLTSYGKAIQTLTHHIENQSSSEDLYISPNFPAFLFKWAAHRSYWNVAAKKNGLSRRELGKKIAYARDQE